MRLVTYALHTSTTERLTVRRAVRPWPCQTSQNRPSGRGGPTRDPAACLPTLLDWSSPLYQLISPNNIVPMLVT